MDSRTTCLASGLALLLAVAIYTGCDGSRPTLAASAPATPPMAIAPPSPMDVVLAAHVGEHALDERIRVLQRRIPTSPAPARELERLGWTFIARARELDDPAAYNMALQSALAIEGIAAHDYAALLLRGHALQSLHHFAEAERVARRLVEERGLPVDHGLLGDVLVDRGELDQAAASYQQMVDMRPDTHSYSRAAHVRYLKGDLAGALEAMQMAARAASPRNRESFAWTWSKLALYQLQSGATDQALDSIRRALDAFPDSYQAHKVEGLIQLSKGELERALAALRAAAARTPHPEVLWMMFDTLEGLGRGAEAAEVRAQLLSVGASEDPRAFALYLATRRENLDLAARLVREELAERKDIYSYEALAWVQSSQGQHENALRNARRSLATGCQDPRLYYHAGLIADRAGDFELARRWLGRAGAGPYMLLPSQRELLAARTAALALPKHDDGQQQAHRRGPTHRKGIDEP